MTEAPSEKVHDQIADTQQEIIVALLDECSGWSQSRIEAQLRHELEVQGVPAPDPWLEAVAEELAEDHLYVVSNSSVASDYFPVLPRTKPWTATIFPIMIFSPARRPAMRTTPRARLRASRLPN